MSALVTIHVKMKLTRDWFPSAGVTIYGATSNTNAYASNTVTISHDEDSTQAGGDDPSGTVRVSSAATGVSLYNLNIENTYVGSQAIALGVQGTEFACYACQLRGYQDTLYVEVGYQFYSGCLITGAVDFIFGKPGASAWITGSTITTVGNGCITASGRDSDDASYYVINDSTVTSTKYVNYLGRPWGDYARVIFQNSYLGSNIAAAGWSEWSTATPNTEDVTYGDPGDWNSARASFATELAAPIAIKYAIDHRSLSSLDRCAEHDDDDDDDDDKQSNDDDDDDDDDEGRDDYHDDYH
ncbi:hypothetical protein FRB98_006102 [Tulasnella sp. 332]|nr:hypothetical protein FRB98_006102 [Tulasnella sp. 332]